jgi:hypothetical protein
MVNVIEKTVPFELNGRTYQLKSTWNVELAIMERFGENPLDLKNESTKESMAKIISLLTIFVNEAVDIHNDSEAEKWDYVEERYVGRYISVYDFAKILNVVADVFSLSRPAPSGEDDEKNKTAPQA